MASNDVRSLAHIYLPRNGKSEAFTSPRSGSTKFSPPPRDRDAHADQLENALAKALADADAQFASRDVGLAGRTAGFYLEFQLPKSQTAILDKLEDRRGKHHIELVAVRTTETQPDQVSATVFVPEQKRNSFLRKIQAYRKEESKGGKPKHEPLIASIESIRLAHARSLFTDAPELFPSPGVATWWEVWLLPETREEFERIAQKVNIVLRSHQVKFAEREVLLALGSPEAIGKIIENSIAIAELRIARDNPAIVMELPPDYQLALATDLVSRIVPPDEDAPAVCLLDSGTTIRHPLLQVALNASDHQAWDVTWNPEDIGPWRGHGTEVSGVALYGDLAPLLLSNESIILRHRLESVKILPDHGQNDPNLYGYVTATAIARAEVVAPSRPRAICLTVTGEGDYWRGRPSSWSAEIDNLSYGDGSDQRLIVVAGGNIRDEIIKSDYISKNDVSPIENPAQSWNAITVGAHTEKCNITSPTFSDWRPVGEAGDLSPRSRTSVSWQHDWPIKPDIVFEGGNLGTDPSNGHSDHVDDLAILTTFRRPQERLFTTTGDTSAASAGAARIAAQILSHRPDLWPETVRGLLIHTAEWTPAMKSHLTERPSQREYATLLRRYGYGVPDEFRAMWSLNNDVTMVIEDLIQPFYSTKEGVKTKDMALHELPWPKDALAALGEQIVSLKVTLSYFIEPNPGERGWTYRHRYSSHGLRYAVMQSDEDVESFRRRINREAREGEEQQPISRSEEGWIFGPNLRNRGSIHSDTWVGTAAALAARHALAVYPTGGWWREKPALKRSDRTVRYSLIVSLKASVDIDLYTPIVTAAAVPVEIRT